MSHAAGSHGSGHGSGHGGMHGQEGKASAVSRTVEVVMHDNYYEPETISVRAGETIRFKVRNAGALVHEFNIGTPQMHAEHMPEMQMMVDHGVLKPDRIDREAAKAMAKTMGHSMDHDYANSALLEPGKSAELIWTFPEATDVVLEFGCTVPGHYGAGMVGRFDLGAGS
ncbi:cupredoxin domain-containing protein [Limibaculum sp. M0105]|uniref:Cupredoxin domain-containing protein n=2 Tax=Thermohalobaculum xanthum TaxID=2753746 RepID=A0A8J7M6N3_9RHOB|nr:cupredoxin domain-containing protein [Thermohalobaculum xanthum]